MVKGLELEKEVVRDMCKTKNIFLKLQVQNILINLTVGLVLDVMNIKAFIFFPLITFSTGNLTQVSQEATVP